jgi:hypothetical protein
VIRNRTTQPYVKIVWITIGTAEENKINWGAGNNSI